METHGSTTLKLNTALEKFVSRCEAMEKFSLFFNISLFFPLCVFAKGLHDTNLYKCFSKRFPINKNVK